jgi:hypothetical protein
MNNKFEILAKLIVPAFFLIVWALNQILSKETPATPARGNRPVGPPGGRPAPAKPKPKPNEEDRAFAAADPKSGAWVSASDSRGNKPVVLAGDDEVLILGSETVRRLPPAKPRTQSSRGNRSKSERRPPSPADAEKQAQRLGGNISQSVRQTLSSTSVDMKSISQSQPLTSLAVDVRGISGASAMVSSTASTAGSAGPIAEVFDLHGALHSRTRIREAFLLNELLQAPVSLRGRVSRSITSPLHR